MALHKISKGLDLPFLGEPEQAIHAAHPVSRVAVLATDFHGLKPALCVAVGDAVKRGQALFEDQSNPGVVHTSPGAGTITAIHQETGGEFTSIVIELSERERAGAAGDDEYKTFAGYSGKPIPALSRDDVRALLLESGLWTAFRTRPFSRTPSPAAVPDAIFITAMDTEPLAPRPEVIVAQNAEAFDTGLAVIAKLREGGMFLCVAKDSPIKAGPYSGISIEQFSGRHPTGTAGAHIHTLYPVKKTKSAWHIGYQDVIRIGVLFKTGRLDVQQVIALAGPAIKSPRLLRTRVGASMREVTDGETMPGEAWIFSGSVLAGRAITSETSAFLGRFHRQIACLSETRGHSLHGWLAPHAKKFSFLKLFNSGLRRIQHTVAFTQSTQSPTRPVLLFGVYRNALPMVRRPAFLLRALLAGDAQAAEGLGCLELDEEDLALCGFVCPGNRNYGPCLRRVLDSLDTSSRTRTE